MAIAGTEYKCKLSAWIDNEKIRKNSLNAWALRNFHPFTFFTCIHGFI